MSPKGRPRNVVATEVRPDGSRRHTLQDGRQFEESGPDFRLEYQSFFPGTTYTREISIFGLAAGRPDLFEAWCYVADDFRTYAFRKTVSVVELHGPHSVTGAELCKWMGGTLELPDFELVDPDDQA